MHRRVTQRWIAPLLALTAACSAEHGSGPDAADAMRDANVGAEDAATTDEGTHSEEPDAPTIDGATDTALIADAPTPVDSAPPSDVVPPIDAPSASDEATPRDGSSIVDAPSASDGATRIDAAMALDVAPVRDAAVTDSARADVTSVDAPRVDAGPPVNDALGRDAELASGWSNTFVFVDEFGRDLGAAGAEALRGLGTTFVYPGATSGRVAVLRFEAGAWSDETIGGLSTGRFGARRVAFVEPSTVSAVFFDEYYYSSGSLRNSGVFYAERGSDRTWRSERVQTAMLGTLSPVDGLCAFADGTAFVQNGSTSLVRATRGSGGAWSVSALTPTTYLSYNGFLTCAQIDTEKFIFTAQPAGSDGLRAFRVGATSMMAEESIAPTTDGRVWGASFLGARLVYTVPPATVRSASRDASGVWTSSTIPFSVASGGNVRQVALTSVAGRTILTLVVERPHPTVAGNSRDEVWILDEARGWAATRVYLPSLGSVRLQRVASDGAALVLGVSMTNYGYSYDIPGSYVYRVLRGTP